MGVGTLIPSLTLPLSPTGLCRNLTDPLWFFIQFICERQHSSFRMLLIFSILPFAGIGNLHHLYLVASLVGLVHFKHVGVVIHDLWSPNATSEGL